MSITALTVLCVVSCTAWDAWRAESTKLLRESQRIEVTATVDSGAITAETLAQVAQLPGVDGVVPRFHRTIYVQTAAGTFEPIQCTNLVPNDPALQHLPVLEGRLPDRDGVPGVIVSPNLCRVLGYPTRGLTGRAIQMCTYVHDPQGGKRWVAVQCPVVAVVGDLGLDGMRVDLGTMARLILWQRRQLYGQIGAWNVQSVSKVPPNTPAGKLAASHTLLAKLGEIDSLDVYAAEPYEETIPRLHKRIEAAELRCTSEFYQRGQRLNLIAAGLKLVVPLVALLAVLVVWTVLVMLGGAVQRDRPLVCLWRASGMTARSVFLFYWLQVFWISAAGVALGVVAAGLLIDGPMVQLCQQLQFPVANFAAGAAAKTIPLLLCVGLAAGTFPAILAARGDIDTALREASCVG